MPNRRETTITNELVNILRTLHHGWHIETEVQAFIEDRSELDALVIERGRAPVGIEAKFATMANARKLTERSETRLLYELDAVYRTFSGKNLTNVIALLYPERFRKMPGAAINAELRSAADLQYKIVTAVDNTFVHFPKNGWARGTVADIAHAIVVGTIPASHLEQVAAEMERTINSAALLIEDAIAEHRAIGEKIEAILYQEVFSKNGATGEERVNTQTLRMAALIITDAFVFQSALAGKAEMESVRSLRQLLPTLDYVSVIADWNAILNVNYRPIFADACSLVEVMATDDRLVRPILRLLCEAAKDLVDTGMDKIHELAGIVFQKLITDRKYIKANYTLPESAVLLSTLVLPRLPAERLPKVADFACGTGALLKGVYQQVLMLYELQGHSGRGIHQEMLEQNIAGVDIMPNATHLTAAALASTYPDQKIGDTRILTAPYGKQGDGSYAVGSLELLDDISLFDTEAERIGGEENTVVALQRAFHDGEFDVIIQNPPFTKHSADGNTGAAKVVFQGIERPEAEKKALQATLRAKKTKVAHGTAGLVSYFVELADRKLKQGGTMGVILPITVLTSVSMQKVRDMWAHDYHAVCVVTIADADVAGCAFSADTKMAECMVVATKGTAADTGTATFISLTERPKRLLEATVIANTINRMNGEDVVRVGEDLIGKVIVCPVNTGQSWGASRVQSLDLLQTGHKLRNSTLSLPRTTTSVKIPITSVEEIAQIGYTEPTIKGKAGAFTMVKGYSETGDGYPALWRADCRHQRSLLALPDSRAKVRPNREMKAEQILARNSRVHYYLSPTLSATSAIVSFTEDPCLGVCILTNVQFADPRQEIAWALWCNTTLGLLCHWMHGSKQQQGRSRLTHTTLKTLPTLDVRRLSDRQLASAEALFDDLKYKRMLPLSECHHDPVRQHLDASLLTDVLGVTDRALFAALQPFREMLCAEPSVHGAKKSTCNLDAELASLKKRGLPFPPWYDR